MSRKNKSASSRVTEFYDRHKANGYRRMGVLVHDEDREKLKEAGKKLRVDRGYEPGE